MGRNLDEAEDYERIESQVRMSLMWCNLNLCWRSSFRSLRTANHFDVPSSAEMARGRTKRSNIRELERSEEMVKINLIEQNRNKRDISFARSILSSPQTLAFEKGLFPMIPNPTQRTNCNQHQLMIHTTESFRHLHNVLPNACTYIGNATTNLPMAQKST